MFNHKPITLLINRDQDGVAAFDIPRLMRWLCQNGSATKNGLEFMEGMISMCRDFLKEYPPRNALPIRDPDDGLTISYSNDVCLNVEIHSLVDVLSSWRIENSELLSTWSCEKTVIAVGGEIIRVADLFVEDNKDLSLLRWPDPETQMEMQAFISKCSRPGN